MSDSVGLAPTVFLNWLREFSKKVGPLLRKWQQEEIEEGFHHNPKRISAPFEVKLHVSYSWASGQAEPVGNPVIVLPKDVFNKVPDAESKFSYRNI